jgi:hypothetical protein
MWDGASEVLGSPTLRIEADACLVKPRPTVLLELFAVPVYVVEAPPQ